MGSLLNKVHNWYQLDSIFLSRGVAGCYSTNLLMAAAPTVLIKCIANCKTKTIKSREGMVVGVSRFESLSVVRRKNEKKASLALRYEYCTEPYTKSLETALV